MYLSRIGINPLRREARRLLANPEALHAVILKVCEANGPTESKDGRILWRVDEADSIWLYIVSPSQPELDQLNLDIGWDGASPQIADYEPFLARIKAGQNYGFRLTANPSAIRTDKETGKKRRVGHMSAGHQQRWLLERCENLGISIPVQNPKIGPSVMVHNRSVLNFRHPENHNVTITQASFDGILKVKDPEKLVTALRFGIGKAKAYGCGLLTLAPAASA